jgi:hypothetical protein
MTKTEALPPRANAEGWGHSKIEQGQHRGSEDGWKPPGARARPSHAGKSGDDVRNRARVDFDAINCAALLLMPAILQRVLPGGRREGQEYVALNPRRADRHLGSFKINLKTGVWCDFSSGDKGRDPVSLVAFIEDCTQGEAALKLARMLGIDARARRNG